MRKTAIALLLALPLGLAACSSSPAPAAAPVGVGEATPVVGKGAETDARMRDDGWLVVHAGDLYMRKMDRAAYTCTSGTRCTAAEWTTVGGCPTSLFVEASLKDSAGRVIGYTNERVGAVPKGGVAVVKLSTYEKATDVIQPTSATCR